MIHRLKEPGARLIAGLLVSIQAVMGVPFLLTIMGSIRHWDGWNYPKNPR
jgi:hypothetical protein